LNDTGDWGANLAAQKKSTHRQLQSGHGNSPKLQEYAAAMELAFIFSFTILMYGYYMQSFTTQDTVSLYTSFEVTGGHALQRHKMQ